MLSILGTPTLQGENKHVKWAETTACFCCSHSSRHNEPAMSVCQIRHNGVFLGTAAMITWKGSIVWHLIFFFFFLQKGGLCRQGKPRKTKHPNLRQGPGVAANHKAAFARTIPAAPCAAAECLQSSFHFRPKPIRHPGTLE